jgi:hypothetical protein
LKTFTAENCSRQTFAALVSRSPKAYMQRMSRGVFFIVIPLVAFLVAAVYLAYRMWTSIGGEQGINATGISALVIGGLGTLIVGGGLMALVFYSSRRGYDDAADFKPPESEDH